MLIENFIHERNTLQLNSEETMDKLRDTDELNEKLKGELESKTIELINSSNDLAHSHSELMKSRREINVSFLVIRNIVVYLYCFEHCFRKINHIYNCFETYSKKTENNFIHSKYFLW